MQCHKLIIKSLSKLAKFSFFFKRLPKYFLYELLREYMHLTPTSLSTDGLYLNLAIFLQVLNIVATSFRLKYGKICLAKLQISVSESYLFSIVY